MVNKYYKNWKASIIDINYSLKEAIQNLNKTALGLCFVNKNEKFYGTITDGDIRRSLLKGVNLNDKVYSIVNTKPHFIFEKKLNKKKNYEKIIKKFNTHLIPVLDSRNKIIDVFFDDIKNRKIFPKLNSEMAILTGGKGKRLMPITKNIPKALVKINGKPILEQIILKAKNEGIEKFNLITFHMHSKIVKYFGNGTKLDVKIQYYKENLPLGTAGGLSLLKLKKSKTMIITNCDILTNINYSDIIRYHHANKNKLTLASRFYKLDNPYGVIKIDKTNKVTGIDEKPSENNLISAGIYVIDTSVLKYLKYNSKIDMTDFINYLASKKLKIGTCPIHENWLDMGTLKDIKKTIRS